MAATPCAPAHGAWAAHSFAAKTRVEGKESGSDAHTISSSHPPLGAPLQATWSLVFCVFCQGIGSHRLTASLQAGLSVGMHRALVGVSGAVKDSEPNEH